MNRKLSNLENVLDKIPDNYKENIVFRKRIKIPCPKCGEKTILCSYFLDYVVKNESRKKVEIVDRYVHVCLNSECDFIKFGHRHKIDNDCFCPLCKDVSSLIVIGGEIVKTHKTDNILGEIITMHKPEKPDNDSNKQGGDLDDRERRYFS